jgi:MFS family permease
MYTIYEPAQLAHTILALVFYVLMLGFVIYSFLSLYTLNKYGRSKILSAGVSLLYIIIIASIFAAAQTNLNNIKF